MKRLEEFVRRGQAAQKAVDQLIADAAEASERYGDDECERPWDAADHADAEAEARVDDEQERRAFDAND